VRKYNNVSDKTASIIDECIPLRTSHLDMFICELPPSNIPLLIMTVCSPFNNYYNVF